MSTISGSCLCQAVTFESDNRFIQFHLCHCTQCQKTSGSAHAANLFTEPDNIRWQSGQDKVRRYDVPGRTITSAFCSDCGCPVPYVSGSGRVLVVPAGSLDGAPNLMPQDHIFWAERACWYEPGLAATHCQSFPD